MKVDPYGTGVEKKITIEYHFEFCRDEDLQDIEKVET